MNGLFECVNFKRLVHRNRYLKNIMDVSNIVMSTHCPHVDTKKQRNDHANVIYTPILLRFTGA